VVKNTEFPLQGCYQRDPALLYAMRQQVPWIQQQRVELLANLKDVSKGKTSLFIAHRLSTISDCDKIVFLEQGSLAEMGTDMMTNFLSAI
jgi:ABC-type transport system involved in Fe-S cluster assembly fused permease/ATPase subunit